MSRRDLFDHAEGFLKHIERHVERNPNAVREAVEDLRRLFAEIERRIDPAARRKLKVIDGGRDR